MGYEGGMEMRIRPLLVYFTIGYMMLIYPWRKNTE